MTEVISSFPSCPIREVARLGRTLRAWKATILAYFDTDGASNGPTEAIQCRRRHWIAYAEVWVMPTNLTSGLFGAGCFAVLSA